MPVSFPARQSSTAVSPGQVSAKPYRISHVYPLRFELPGVNFQHVLGRSTRRKPGQVIPGLAGKGNRSVKGNIGHFTVAADPDHIQRKAHIRHPKGSVAFLLVDEQHPRPGRKELPTGQASGQLLSRNCQLYLPDSRPDVYQGQLRVRRSSRGWEFRRHWQCRSGDKLRRGRQCRSGDKLSRHWQVRYGDKLRRGRQGWHWRKGSG